MSAQLRGLGSGQILGSTHHPSCDIPNRRRSQRVSLNELFTAIGRFVLVRSRPDATSDATNGSE